ncbi:DNA repair protein rad5 [Erysiphe neolycopersici]|uniref:DNA repair protein rad5 n=1 Tax=Erysiphe neolycopersici TaxID=212602 RepID=A0A420I6E0_9PEZI|nr:DNA repair protein rad5 [Erysiphe neolycopersici]
MSMRDFEGPPVKKRRFFSDQSDTLLNPPNSDLRTHCQKDISVSTTSGTGHALRLSGSVSHHFSLSEPNESSSGIVSASFEDADFQHLVGKKVAPNLIKRLRDASGGQLEKAINLYFDGFCDNSPPSFQLKTSDYSHKNTKDSVEKTHISNKSPPSNELIPESRYIGAFGCEGWVTRSGTTLIKHGDIVRIERQRIQPHKSLAGKGKQGQMTAQVVPKVNLAVSRRVDVLVRFTNTKGEEIGRIPQNSADWISTLIDQKVCKFEGVCVYAPERLRSGDTVFLQLQCFLLRTAFNTNTLKLQDNRKTSIFEEKESYEEKQLSQKQASLVKLFKEINLVPSKSSETMEKQKRDRILQATKIESVDQHDKSKKNLTTGPETDSSSQVEEIEDGKELEQDQLDALYEKAQSFDFNSPAAEPSESFTMSLRHYQKQALYWMVSKEKNSQNSHRELSMHPLWEEYTWPTNDADDKKLPSIPNQDKFYVNPYSGELSLKFPVQEQKCLGGILADEMGLGKTIEMMSLIHTNKSSYTNTLGLEPCSNKFLTKLPINQNDKIFAPSTTLIVAPMSLLAQWQSEAERASKGGTLNSFVYYGNDKTSDLKKISHESIEVPNIIITSYGVILSEFNQVATKNSERSSNFGLFSFKYFRVILDEAHYIKNRQSKTAKACYEIEAEHRWALTGTPIVNRLEDLFSLIRFLRVEPWSNFSFWRTFITVPFESKDVLRALDVVQTILEPLALRRTKDMKTPSGEALVPLPPKTIEIVNIELSKKEQEVYDHILNKAKQSFEANVEAGTALKAFTSIFAHVMRLRQSCCHPVLTRNPKVVADEEEATIATDTASGLTDDMTLQSLIDRFAAETSDLASTNIFGAHALKQIRDDAQNECPICSEEPMIERIVTTCWHSSCKKCLLDYINHQIEKGEKPRCATCREFLDTQNLFEVVKDEEASDDGPPKYNLHRLGATSSAKILALLSHLKRLRRDAPGTKTVVFSQFTSFLSLIEPALSQAQIPFMRLDGSMAQKIRANVLAEFASSCKGIVLLISLRAGGVGLNLTMAKRVYMMDPWWSFAVEAQAIDRVHRMGQLDEVKVYRFIVENSVEERMLKIQDRKKFIASSLGMMNDEEKKLQRLEDIKELLS